MSIFYKNCIVSGEVDHYCLLCREAFTKQDQLPEHIEQINHKKKVKSLTYLKKFQHKIYKIDHIYYCRVCSEVINTISSLHDHVQEDKHKANIEANELPLECSENRTKLVERQEETEFVLLCDLKLNNLQWHSIIGNNCWLCDKVIPNMNEIEEHLGSLNHMVRLIQSKCHIYNIENTQYFRKINEDKFYCFICEKTFPMSSLTTHWEEKEHVVSLNAISPSLKSSPPIDPKVLQNELKLLESQMQYYNVEEDSRKAVCKQCLESLPMKYIKLVKHRKKHIAVSWPTDEPETSSQPKPIDYGQHRANMAKFAKENLMRTTHGGHRAFCLLCKVHIPATKKKVMEHIKGLRHQGFLQIKGHIEWYMEKKEPTECFTLSEYVEHVFPLPSKSSLIINGLYLLDVLSFNLIVRIEIDKHIRKTFCYICDIYLHEDEEKEHIKDETHLKQKCEDVRVIADFDNDFIRKIRGFEYHCGFCNELWPSYQSISNHVSTEKHEIAKQFQVLPQGYSKILNDNVTEAQICAYLEHFYKNQD